jgi:hypothetical protein
MKAGFVPTLAFGLAIVPLGGVRATTIPFDLLNVAGNRYEYIYTVVNDTLPIAIDEFTIFFPLGLYDNLEVARPMAGWDEITVNPELILGIPIDGFYDALALVSGVPPGASVSGFSVAFDWLGAGIPGAQRFEVVDPATFAVLDSGVTGIPEPGSLLLLVSGVLGLASVLLRTSARLR